MKREMCLHIGTDAGVVRMIELDERNIFTGGCGTASFTI